MSSSQESSILSECLMPREDSSMDLLLDMKPSCNFNDLVEALRNSTERITAVHIHKLFMRDLKQPQQTAIFDALHDLSEISVSFVTMPMSLLANVILRSKQLSKISLDRVALVSDPSDFKDDVFFSALQSLDSLKQFHLSLSTTGTAPEGHKLSFQADDELDTLFQSLSGIPALEKVYISVGQNMSSRTNIRAQTLQALLSNSSVQDFSVVNVPLHKEHCQVIVDRGSQLETVSLMNAEIGDEGATIFANALENNSSLKPLNKLCLSGNKITSTGGARLIQSLAQREQGLQVLDLHSNDLTACFGNDLAVLLEQDMTLKFLDVSNNDLQDSAITAIAAALLNNNTLQQLNLFDTKLTNKSCEAFATALTGNTTLKKLNLYNNINIDASGIQVLAAALEHHNYCLERLEVSHKNTISRGQDESGLELYLRLNREFSRGEMLSFERSEAEYVEGIQQAVAKNQLSSIFYFLKARPSLCC